MMTGWSGEPPEAEAPALPLTAKLMANRERGPGDTLAIAAARSRAADARQLLEEEAQRRDPDEAAANMVTRGYMPGMLSDLSRSLADTVAELATEREKIAKGERVNARVRGMLERGQIGGLEASRMLDGDYGDLGRAEKLERRADALRRQVAEVSQLIPRPENREPADPLEAASRHAHEVFREVTRQRMAEAQAGRPAPRPFAGRGSAAVRSEQPVTCAHCVKYGATPEQSYLLHADPEAPAEVRLPTAELTEADLAQFETGVPFRSATLPDGEIIRAAEGAILGVR